MSPSRRILEQLPLLILVLLLLAGTLLSGSFLTVTNIGNLVHYNAELALICLGLMLVIIAGGGGIDLSVGSTLALSGVLTAQFAQYLGLSGSLALALALGSVIGLVNGILVTKGRLEPFISTFIVASITTALTLIFTGGGPVLANIPASVTAIASTRLWGFPLPFYYFIFAYLVGVVTLRHTTFGRHLYALGANSETVRLAGVRVLRLQIGVYVLSGMLAALAGLLTTARLGMGEPRAGLGVELTAISAVVVGGVSLYGGRGTVTGGFVGILIFAVMLNLMNIMNMSAYYQPIAKGMMIVVAGLILSRRATMFTKA